MLDHLRFDPRVGRFLTGIALAASLVPSAASAAADVSGTQTPGVVHAGDQAAAIFTFRISNTGLLPITFDGITFQVTTSGPGTRAELDSEMQLVRLYRDDGDGLFESAADAFLGSAVPNASLVTFTGFGSSILPLIVATFHVAVDASILCRDGDVLDLAIPDGSRVLFTQAVAVSGSFPIDPAGGLLVDGMVAAQIPLKAISDTTVTPGARDVLAMDFVVLPNGYEGDVLEELRFANLGTTTPNSDLKRLDLWRDRGDGVFDAGDGDDAGLGEAVWDGSYFELSSIAEAVPAGGIRLFASARFADDATLGSTLHIGLVGPSEKGVVMSSDNDGPIDAQVASPRQIRIAPTTIQAFAAPQSGATLRPGAPVVDVFDLTLVHTGGEAETLMTVSFANTTAGPGSIGQLDAEWTPLRLSARRVSGTGGAQVIGPIPIGGVSFVGGTATFTGLGLVLAPGDSATLTIEGGASLVGRDGDLLDLAVTSEASIGFRRTVNIVGTFPLAPAGRFPVDGMTSAQIGIASSGTGNLLTGSVRNVVLSVLLPANGYSPDQLRRLDLVNTGSADPNSDLARLEAWADDGDAVFEAGSDARLGELLYTGDRWQISGLTRTVPTSGLRVFVTCDIAADATDGRTVRLALPSIPDVAIGMSSANDGPIDAAVTGSATQSISTVDRIVLTPLPLTPGVVAPGDAAIPLLHLILTNTYSVPRTLAELTVTNRGSGPGTITQRDGEVDLLEVRLDADWSGDLGGLGTDPSIAQAVFSGGRARLDGLDLVVGPGSSIGLFVTANAALFDARDGDSLACDVASPADVSFQEVTSLSGMFPLSSSVSHAVDGMIAAQIGNFDAPSTTLGPSEGPALALDVRVPSNGYASDVLRGVTLQNAGTATASDLQDMILWRDGGDGAFDAGAADDISLGSFIETAGQWTSPLLTEGVPVGGVRLFASITSSTTPTDSASVRLTIPVDGIVYDSSNDGPRDAEVSNSRSQLLSTAALLASFEIDPSASVLGAPVTARVEVRNAGLATVDAIAPSAFVAEGTGSLTLVSGPTPLTFSLDPGESGTFDYALSADGAGDVRFTGSVSGTEQGSGFTRQSLTTTSNTHWVFVPATTVDLFPVESMPFSINRGQNDVVPLTLTLAHPGGANASPIRVEGLSIALENDLGSGIVPADLLSRIVVREGATVYLDKTALETSGSQVDLTFTTPVVVDASGSNGGQTTLNLALDIADSTLVPNFRIIIADSTWFDAADAVSGQSIEVALQDGTYPIRSGLARVVAEATQLDVTAATAAADRSAGLGQDDVAVLTLQLVNPDPGGLASDVRLGTFDAQLVDSAGTAIEDPSRFIERIRVRTPFQTVLDRTLTASDDSTLTLVLSPVLSIPVNAPLPLTVLVDIAANAELETIRMKAGASTSFDARDANTGNPVPVVFSAGHPAGPAVHIESPADRALVGGAPRFPASAPVGAGDLAAFDLTIQHPGPAGASGIRCDSLTIALRDDRGAGLVPAMFLDRLRVLRAGLEVGAATTFFATGDEVRIPLANVVIDPADSASLQVIVDFEATAPASFLEMVVSATGVHARDENLGTPTSIEPVVGAELPIRSGLVRIESPARLLVASSESIMPPVLVAGGSSVAAMRLTLANPAPLAASTIRVASIEVAACDGSGGAVALGAAARAVELVRGGALWANATGLGPGDPSAVLIGPEELSIAPGESVVLELRFETAAAPSVPAIRIVVDSPGIGVVQPASALLTIQLQAADGAAFPFRSLTGSFAGSTLRESYSNFPNPFAAGRAQTNFAFYLRESAIVKLRILTARGEEVVRLLDGESLGAGLHQDRSWDGRNGRGDTVLNGVYVAELEVRYADGASERELRKVAVVR